MAQYLNETYSSGSFLIGKTADVGGTWSNPASFQGTGDINISGGRGGFDASSIYSYYNTASPGDDVQDITVEWTPFADNWFAGCVARYQTTGGAQLLCWINSSTFTVVNLASNTDWTGTTLCTATPTIAAGDRSSHTLRFKVDASGVITVWLDGASVTLTGTTTDNTLTASGSKSGFWGRGATSTQVSADDTAAAAPVITSPSGAATGPTQATIGVTTDTAPTTTAISYQILPAATGAPSAATIVGAPDGTISTGSAGALTKAITGLTTNTAVKAHFAQGSSSNVVSTDSFTPSTLASSGTLSAQSGAAGGAITWAGATPQSLLTNTGNGSGAWSIVSSAGFTVAPSINTSTGVLSGGTLSSAGSYAPQIRYTDSSTVPSAQTVTHTLSLTVSAGALLSINANMDVFISGMALGQAPGVINFGPLKNGSGFRWDRSDITAIIQDRTTGAVLATLTGVTSGASGGQLSSLAIQSGGLYRVSFRIPAGGLLPNGAKGEADLSGA